MMRRHERFRSKDGDGEHNSGKEQISIHIGSKEGTKNEWESRHLQHLSNYVKWHTREIFFFFLQISNQRRMRQIRPEDNAVAGVE